jgi:hypothetical protein
LVPEKKIPKKGKKGKKVVDDDLSIGSHEAAVMGLSWYVLAPLHFFVIVKKLDKF